MTSKYSDIEVRESERESEREREGERERERTRKREREFFNTFGAQGDSPNLLRSWSHVQWHKCLRRRQQHVRHCPTCWGRNVEPHVQTFNASPCKQECSLHHWRVRLTLCLKDVERENERARERWRARIEPK